MGFEEQINKQRFDRRPQRWKCSGIHSADFDAENEGRHLDYECADAAIVGSICMRLFQIRTGSVWACTPAKNIEISNSPIWDIADKFSDTNLLVTNIVQGCDLAKGSAAMALPGGRVPDRGGADVKLTL
jgi:hypothetical protein